MTKTVGMTGGEQLDGVYRRCRAIRDDRRDNMMTSSNKATIAPRPRANAGLVRNFVALTVDQLCQKSVDRPYSTRAQ